MQEGSCGEVVLEMRGITKRFGTLTVNNKINLSLKKGEVHAILGENGAGKTTLMKILYGEYKPNEGEIYIDGIPAVIKDPADAIRKGIGMVYQHFMLVETLTVLENLLLGIEKTRFGFLKKRDHRAELTELIEQYGFDIDLDSKVSSISIGMQQRVEILKTIYRGAKIVILDEPSAVLTPKEIQGLMGIIRRLTSEGKSILLITHKLREIKEIANRCTVIRHGEVVGCVDIINVVEEDLAFMMIGRVISFNFSRTSISNGAPLLEMKNVTIFNEDKVPKLNQFTLELREGEILGIAGVDGNGQAELMEALAGIRSYTGDILFRGRSLRGRLPKDIFDLGISSIPQDRCKEGLILEYSMKENLVLRHFNRKPFSEKGILNFKAIQENALKLQEEFDIRPRKPDHLVSQFSGGNQQKIIIAREIFSNPEVLVAAHPTRGLDIGAIQYIYEIIIRERDKGKGVLLISFEMEELLSICDRIAVIFQGEVIDTIDKGEANEEMIGIMMMGQLIDTRKEKA